MKVEQTECFETSANKIETLGNYPEESIQIPLGTLHLFVLKQMGFFFFCMISGFCHSVYELVAFLGCWDITQHRLAVVSVSGKHIGPIIKGTFLKLGPIGCPKTSAHNYQSVLHNIPEEQTCKLDFLN